MSTSSTLKTLLHEIPAPLMVIVGPTAVGKTELSLQLAERLDGEIVSADSRLFYRGMDIGTAKPSAEERLRVPHHLIDVADPDQTWSLSIFQQAASQAIAGIHARGRLPLLVGGTGQYVRAVMEGWDLPPQEPDPALRAVLEQWATELGGQALHERLRVVDPQAADLIDFRNVRRTIRALEVIFGTGRRFSEQRQRSASPYSLLTIGLRRQRADLYRRIDQRIQAMLETGLIDEVRRLLDLGYAPGLPTMSAIGYREIGAYLRGETSLEEAVALMKRITRRFVRHQGAWFGESDPTIHWFDADSPDLVERVTALVHTHAAWRTPSEQD